MTQEDLQECHEVYDEEWNDKDSQYYHTGWYGVCKGNTLIGLQEFVVWWSPDGQNLELNRITDKVYHLRIR
jgi:hypothetical protein